jgi:hypothetical protein
VKKISELPEKMNSVIETHEELAHRESSVVYYKWRAKWHWSGMKEMIDQVIRKYEVCNINNRKKQGGCEFVIAMRKLEERRSTC